MTRQRMHVLLSLALLGLAGCGGDSDGSGTDGSSSGAASSGSSESTGAEPVTCGQPGDEATTDEQVAALAGCEAYRGSLRLLSGVSTVAPLSSLRVVEGELLLGGTDSPLQTLAGLEQLESVGTFTFNSHNLPDLSAMQSLQEVKGDFTLLSMFNFVDCRGLEMLRVIDGDFLLLANPMLTSLDGLDGLQQVKGNFEATSYMTPLPRSEVQALVDRIEIGGTVDID